MIEKFIPNLTVTYLLGNRNSKGEFRKSELLEGNERLFREKWTKIKQKEYLPMVYNLKKYPHHLSIWTSCLNSEDEIEEEEPIPNPVDVHKRKLVNFLKEEQTIKAQKAKEVVKATPKKVESPPIPPPKALSRPPPKAPEKPPKQDIMLDFCSTDKEIAAFLINKISRFDSNNVARFKLYKVDIEIIEEGAKMFIEEKVPLEKIKKVESYIDFLNLKDQTEKEIKQREELGRDQEQDGFSFDR